MEENAISLVQLPIIRERLEPISKEIDKRVTEALSLAVTPETVQTVKKVRAQIRKEYEELERQRKQIKAAVMDKYNEFEQNVYKPLISVRYEEGDKELKRKINSVEDGLKQEKEDELREYFRELANSMHLPWLNYERGRFNVTLSKSMKAMKQEVSTFVERVHSDVQAISVMPDNAEIMSEYKLYLRLGEAVETVKMRREAVEREMQAQEKLKEILTAEREAEEKVLEETKETVLSAPKKIVENAVEKLKLTFTVTDTRERLKVLKAFLDSNNYQYE